MSRCPDCGCGLPDSQTLCSRCYNARYAELGRATESKPFLQRLTRRNVLLFFGIFAVGFLEFRFDTRDFFPFNVFYTYRYHLMPTRAAAITAIMFALIAFYMESSRRR